MQTSRQPAPRYQSSDQYLIVKIDKRAALFFLGGVAVVAAILVFLMGEPTQLTVQEGTSVADSAVTPSTSAAHPSPAGAQPGSAISGSPAMEVAAPVEPRPSDQSGEASAPLPRPSPAVASSPAFVPVYRVPLQPTFADTSSADSPPSDPPANPDTPSNPDPAPNVPAQPAEPAVLAMVNGAGATFPYPLYSKWFDEYRKVSPNVQFNYQAVGSGAGVKQLQEKVVDFTGTDAPLNDQQVAKVGFAVFHVPTVIGGVVPVYNLPGSGELRFTPEILAGIYTGTIDRWNDPAISVANPTKNLPQLPILVIHRSDGCAATYIFTDYLSKVSPDWRQTVGTGTSVNWPVGNGAKGNEGAASLLKQGLGAIAYVDFQYAAQNQVPFGSVLNSSGKFIKVNLASLAAASSSIKNIDDFRVSISNAPGVDAYPISSFTWIVVPVHSRSTSEGMDLREFLRWMLRKRSQAMASGLGYAPLPEELAARIDGAISRIR